MLKLPLLRRMTEPRLMIATALALLIAILIPGVRAHLEDLTFRAGVAISGHVAGAPELTFIAIDDGAVEAFGPPPWPKGTMARAIDRLRLMNARAIVVDAPVVEAMGFTEVRPTSRDSAAPILAGYDFYPTLSDIPSGSTDAATDAKTAAAAADFSLPTSPADDAPLLPMAGIDPAAASGAQKRSSRDGFSNLFPDADGVVRRQPLTVRLRHRAFPSLALSTAALSRGETPLITEAPSGKPDGILMGESKVETDEATRIPIPFSGAPGSFPRIGFAEVTAGKASADEIADRIVLIGLTAKEAGTFHQTPLGRMPASEIQAHLIANLMRFRPFTPLTGMPWSIAAILLVAASMLILSRRHSTWPRVATLVAAAIAVWIGAMALFHFTGVLIPAATFGLAAAAFIVIALAWRTFGMEIPKRRIGRAWKMRVSDEELSRAIAIPGTLDPRGRGANLTALALDLRGFGATAHTIPADRLCSLLRGTRTIIADVLLKHGALIDSWAGDECRAAFGALAPRSDHALTTCRSVSALLRALSQVREEVLHKHGIQKLRPRIGIGSGPAAVGELGPKGSDGFGVTGGAMESACTLRALNRTYRTGILVEEAVYAAAEASFTFRPLDPVLLHADGAPVVLYEMLGETGVILPQMPLYLEARHDYLHGDFARAVQLFSKLVKDYPADGPSQLFLRRARILQNQPPPRWEGIWGQ